jgi:outer membrane protein assembly factor BamB
MWVNVPVTFTSKVGQMEFTLRGLSVLAYAQGFTLWHYKHPKAGLSVVSRPGFFDLASDMLASGDMLFISAADGGRLAFVSTSGNAVSLFALA